MREREKNVSSSNGGVSEKKPYNLRERKIKNAAYRDMIRAELADELYDKIVNVIVVQKKYKDPDYSARIILRKIWQPTLKQIHAICLLLLIRVLV